jgi:hypothetical protein
MPAEQTEACLPDEGDKAQADEFFDAVRSGRVGADLSKTYRHQSVILYAQVPNRRQTGIPDAQ